MMAQMTDLYVHLFWAWVCTALVLKPQAISIHNVDETFIVLNQIHTTIAFMVNAIREYNNFLK